MPAASSKASLKYVGTPVANGSAKSEWMVAHSNAAVADTTYLINPLSSSVSTNVIPVTIPMGATRVLVRGRAIGNGTYSVGTLPVVRLWSSDGTYATRLDNTDQSAAGVTITFDATGTNNSLDSSGLYYLSDLPTNAGYDCLGGETLYVLVETAADLNSSTEDVKILVAFLNS